VIFLLVLGLVINVISTWALAASWPRFWTSTILERRVEPRWPPEAPTHWPPPFISEVWTYWWLTTQSTATQSGGDGGWFTARIGVPFRSMDWSYGWEWKNKGQYPPPQVDTSVWCGGIRLHKREQWPYRRLPIRPRPFGFVANTLFYAGALHGLMVLVNGWQRRSRRRRGECVACRYPVIPGADRCPECGHNPFSGRRRSADEPRSNPD
jgi:hypothetical protein